MKTKERKTLQLVVDFWTDGVGPTHTAFASGKAYLRANRRLGVKPGQVFFSSVASLGAAIEQLMMAQDVTLRAGRGRKKLYT